MIMTGDIGCWQPSESPLIPAISRCIVSASDRATPAIEILQKDNAFVAQFRAGHGNNNGNGNVGNNNGNFNTGNNNGNFNLGNGNGNCFADDNNENNRQSINNWDYRRLMQELKRCGVLNQRVP